MIEMNHEAMQRRMAAIREAALPELRRSLDALITESRAVIRKKFAIELEFFLDDLRGELEERLVEIAASMEYDEECWADQWQDLNDALTDAESERDALRDDLQRLQGKGKCS